MTERVGFIGLGIMGGPMCRNLLQAGFPLVVYDTDAAKVQALVDAGATAAESPAALAGAVDVMLACLPSAEVVDAVVSGPAGLLEGCREGQVFADHTTNYPPTSIKVAGLLAERGVQMLDAPVSGGRGGAEAGTLSIMCGGPRAAFDRLQPVFEAMGQRMTLLGEEVGAGGYAKLANQIMVSIHFMAIAEAFTFAAKAGLDMNELVPALQAGWANSTVLGVKAPAILARDFSPIGTVTVQHKDLTYITRAAEAMGLELPFCPQIKRMYETLIEQGKGGIDQMALIQLLEAQAGVEVKG